MIGLDTNILVRFLTQDDPRQSPIATDIIQNRLTSQDPGFVSLVTVAETVWVLEARYGVSLAEAAEAIAGLISQDSIVVDQHDAVVTAIENAREAKADFSDLLIAALGQKAGCSVTLTFDKRAAGLAGFALAK